MWRLILGGYQMSITFVTDIPAEAYDRLLGLYDGDHARPVHLWQMGDHHAVCGATDNPHSCPTSAGGWRPGQRKCHGCGRPVCPFCLLLLEP